MLTDSLFSKLKVQTEFRDLWKIFTLLCSYSFDPDLRANKSSSMGSPCSLFNANTRRENCRYRKEDRSGDPWVSRDPFGGYSGSHLPAGKKRGRPCR